MSRARYTAAPQASRRGPARRRRGLDADGRAGACICHHAGDGSPRGFSCFSLPREGGPGGRRAGEAVRGRRRGGQILWAVRGHLEYLLQQPVRRHPVPRPAHVRPPGPPPSRGPRLHRLPRPPHLQPPLPFKAFPSQYRSLHRSVKPFRVSACRSTPAAMPPGQPDRQCPCAVVCVRGRAKGMAMTPSPPSPPSPPPHRRVDDHGGARAATLRQRAGAAGVASRARACRSQGTRHASLWGRVAHGGGGDAQLWDGGVASPPWRSMPQSWSKAWSPDSERPARCDPAARTARNPGRRG